jgi:hypothetical protein
VLDEVELNREKRCKGGIAMTEQIQKTEKQIISDLT